MRDLSSKEKAELRGVAQRLKPSIYVGKNGITDGIVVELKKFLKTDGLVKVGFSAHRDELPGQEQELEKCCDCVCVGGAGKKKSFFREREEDSSGDS